MQYLKIGFITKPHGINGELKVIPLTDDKERYKKLTNVYLLNENNYKPVKIQSIKKTNDSIIIKFENYNSKEEAEKLRNIYIFIDRNDGVPLADGEYYTQDLVDCSIYYKDKLFGKIKDIINEGSCDIFIIKYINKEIFYPFINDYIDDIDIKNKKININYIEGYFD